MTNKKFAAFQKSHDDAIKSINRFLESCPYEPQMNGLVKWMMETDANPYSYLPEGWAGSTGSAETFVTLLSVISHALYDDGDITFVTVDNEPRIVFVWHGEDNFSDYVLSTSEKSTKKRQGVEYEIKVLDIKPNEFSPLYDAYQVKQLKRYFLNDARSHSLEFAVEHYQKKYKLFDDAWIAEFNQGIEE